MRALRFPAVAFGVAVVLLAASIAPAAGGELRVPQVGTSLSGRDVRVSASLSPGLPAEARKRLEAGLPTTVAWEIRLCVSRDGWFDGLRDERQYAVTATYRPVSGDSTVERRLDGRLLETVVLPGREEAEKSLATIAGLPSFTLGAELAGKPLVVKVRCLYGTEVSLGFVPTRSRTAWRTSSVFSFKEGGEAP